MRDGGREADVRIVEIDTTSWSGEGAFTQIVLDHLKHFDCLAHVRVEDAPSSRSDASYNFVSNEIYVVFAVEIRHDRALRFGLLPTRRVTTTTKLMTMETLLQALAEIPEVGPADYADEGMLQYLRSERIVPPYQTRGYKLVEMVRIYEAGTTPASRAAGEGR